eukprot:TRINITY_DN4843_c0_g2_i2.p1 TRINITY_DN4843_c0_g2~~TRINITY_DN4843_c0_g2_i2.p1  ORF type:complete len:296 (-),score=24.60 TRINITY_DN4843_c0_g2_i2:128-1015(-)
MLRSLKLARLMSSVFIAGLVICALVLAVKYTGGGTVWKHFTWCIWLLMCSLVLIWCLGGGGARSHMVRAINIVIIALDHALMPANYLLDRILIWPAVISIWFTPARPWPKPWAVTYSKLLDALTEFFLERYPPGSDNRHPYCLSEEEFEAMMRSRLATHTMIPVPLHWISAFIKALPPVTTTLFSLALIPLLRWFVGPMQLHVDEDGAVGIEVLNCRFLQEARNKHGESKGNDLCVKQCGIAMEQIWRERGDLETWLDPDLTTGRCRIHAKSRPKGITYLEKDCGKCLQSADLDW